MPQVKRFFRDQGFRAQAPKSEDIYIAQLEQRIIGALRLQPFQPFWLLRSMCIDQDYQRQGIGLFMLKQLHAELNERQCFCFPFKYLDHFYQTAGFNPITPEQAPKIIADKFNHYRSQGKDILLHQFGHHDM